MAKTRDTIVPEPRAGEGRERSKKVWLEVVTAGELSDF